MLDRDGYRPNVAIVIVNARNQVFWGKRIREHSWQFPQGGINAGETPEEAITDEAIQKRLNGVLKRTEPYPLTHKTIYRVHQRVVTTYNVGRILLAGDSAHLNNPLGGMGMNGGIHDATNLTTKINAVWKGEADDSVFDRYTRQRQPIAVEFVQAQAERNRQLLRERDSTVRLARFHETVKTANDPAAARAFLMRSSMIESLRRSEQIA